MDELNESKAQRLSTQTPRALAADFLSPEDASYVARFLTSMRGKGAKEITSQRSKHISKWWTSIDKLKLETLWSGQGWQIGQAGVRTYSFMTDSSVLMLCTDGQLRMGLFADFDGWKYQGYAPLSSDVAFDFGYSPDYRDSPGFQVQSLAARLVDIASKSGKRL